MEAKLVGLGGYVESGKDAVADILESVGWFRTYMSHPLEQALVALNPVVAVTPEEIKALFGSNEEMLVAQFVPYATLHKVLGYERSKKIADVRRLLQKLGTEVGRRFGGQQIWVDAVFEGWVSENPLTRFGVDGKLAAGVNVAVTGIRYDNEAYAVKERGGVLVWVDRPGYGPVNSHSSDNSLTVDNFDLVLDNKGTLYDLRDLVITRLCGGETGDVLP